MNSEEHSGQKNTDYFLDTYALIEILLENPHYSKYIDKPFVITKLNLFELHHHLLREKGELVADELARSYLPNLVDYNLEIIKKASKFRKLHKGKNISMTDCIGYIYAKESELVFVTGDGAFDGLENVEFVK